MSPRTRETVYCATVWFVCLAFCGMVWIQIALYLGRHL